MTSIKKATKATGSKKITNEDIEKKLATSFATLKLTLGDKKFKHRIKKAVKILTHGLDKNKDSKPKVAKVKIAAPAPVPVVEKTPVKTKKVPKK